MQSGLSARVMMMHSALSERLGRGMRWGREGGKGGGGQEGGREGGRTGR